MRLGISENVFGTVGGTPMVKLKRLTDDRTADVFLKLEQMNPMGSAKDRSAYPRIVRAEESGLLKPGHIVVEASTGNAAVSLALVCKTRGYRCLIVLPESSPLEYRTLLRALGAEVRLVPAIGGLAEAALQARQLARAQPDAWYAGQVEDPEGWRDFAEFGEELVAQSRAKGTAPDAFVCGVGTGAILVAAAKALRAAFPRIRILGVCRDPTNNPQAPVISGLGEGLAVPGSDRVDGIVKVDYREALNMRRELARSEGILTGDSTGANVVAALKLARELGRGGQVYSLCVDSGERYFSTEASPS